MSTHQDIIAALVAEHAQNELNEAAALHKAEEDAARQFTEVVIPDALKRFAFVGVLTMDEIEALFKGGKVSCFGSVTFESPRIPFLFAEVLSTVNPEVRFRITSDSATRSFYASNKEHRAAVLALIAEAYSNARQAEILKQREAENEPIHYATQEHS